MYLLHTSIVSELRSRQPQQDVVDWITGIEQGQIYLSSVTVGEIQSGIEIARDRDAAGADELDAWLDRVHDAHNVLPLDSTVFRQWARLLHRRWDIRPIEGLIAATAVVHRLTVVTGDPEVFDKLGVATLNPFGKGPVDDRTGR